MGRLAEVLRARQLIPLLRSGNVFVYGLLVASCGAASESPSSDFTVADSAGIEIIDNWGADVGDAQRWIVSPEPTVSLGAVEDRGAEQFSRIGGVVRLGEGTIVVLESLSAELRFFSSNGSHLRTVAGVGDGPGELRLPRPSWANSSVRGQPWVPCSSCQVVSFPTWELTE